LNFLNEDDAEKLVRSGLKALVISLDGASQEVYQRYRIGGDLSKVLENTKLIVEKKKKLNSSSPYIIIQFLVMRHNEHEMSRIRKIADEIGVDSLRFRPIYIDSLEKDRDWLPSNDRYNRYKILEPNLRKKPCFWLWTGAVINWDCSISPCSGGQTYDKKWDFGNMFEEGFKKIWNNKKYRASRKLFHGKKAEECDTVCFKCQFGK